MASEQQRREDPGEQLACPSAPGLPGSSLLAIIGSDGRLAHLSPPIPVDEAFVAAAARHGAPEARMRFTAPCLKEGCAQWTGSSCGVIEQVLATGAHADQPTKLPRCAIRSGCRWYRQEGGEACRACPLVLTDGDATGSSTTTTDARA
jgi:hypothetical protein